MKSKMKIKMKIAGKLWGLSAILLFVSCAKGFDDNETFSGGVTNAQLESPENISFSTLTNADEKATLEKHSPVYRDYRDFYHLGYRCNVLCGALISC